MKTEKNYRRVKLTKMLLKKSLAELMYDNPISKISVKLLCEAADINRSTFYAHFTDYTNLILNKNFHQTILCRNSRKPGG